MTIVLQGLGRVDCRRIPEDKQFLQLSQEERETIEQSISMSDRFTYSYLWVLGAYELVRTLDQRCHADPALLGNNLTTRVRELKHSMERLRMPLAKMETANRYPSDDSIAWPSIHPNHGVAWRVTTGIFISRRQLSDDLLELAEAIRGFREAPSS